MKSNINERLTVLRLLLKVWNNKTPLSYLLQNQAEVTPLCKEMCFGICRQYFRLETIADFLIQKRPKELEIWLSLIIGLYQLHYLRIPDYAVVQETVALMEHLKKPWAKGLINAVLRRYCREQDNISQQMAQHRSYIDNHPEWFVKRVQHSWPSQWQAILQANDAHPPMSLRVNTAHTTANDYLNRLKQHQMSGQTINHAPQGLLLTSPCNVQDLPGFAQGEISVQDGAAQIAVSLLDLQPKLRVLDACCAPGGKTCHILETQPDLLECFALDIESKRLDRVKENLNRLHLNACVIQGDALKPSNWWDGQLFDRILLDAPCTATGVIRRHPDIKLLRQESDIDAIVQLQRQLLLSLWPLLKPQGRMVYATCSILAEENEAQISKFVAENTSCQVLKMNQPWGHFTGHGWQILPGENDMDGFFYSVLLKLK